jgi:hypothetical protein
LVVVQPPLKVGYFVREGEGGQGTLLFPPSDSGGKALGNVEDSDGVVLVELHHSFSRGGRDGARWSRGGPYGGRRAKGHFDHSVNGDIRHSSQSVGVVIRARVIFAKPGVDEGVIRGLIVDPQEKELSWLEVRLELKGDNLERGRLGGEGLWFGCNCLG